MPWPTAGQYGRNLGSDGLKLGADTRGFWDGLAKHLVESNLVPKSKLYRLALFCALSGLGTLAQVNLNDQRVFGKLLMELTSDMPSALFGRFRKIERRRARKARKAKGVAS